MNTFILILVGLQLGVPVRCYEAPQDWKAVKAEVLTDPRAVAFYNPNETPYIALGPRVCKEVRTPTFNGAFVLAHELGHMMQDRNDTPFSEEEADQYAS